MSRRREDPKKRPVKRVVWLIVEGETELRYLTGLRNDSYLPRPTPPVTIKPKCAGGGGPQNVVDTANKYRNQQDGQLEDHRFLCVFDTEDPTPEGRQNLEKALREAEKEKFDVVLSNPCFEVWLRCHLDSFTRRQFDSCEDCLRDLCQAWNNQNISLDPYQKGDSRIYGKLSSRLNTAIETARRLREEHHKTITRTADANASTDLYRLVEYLQGKANDYRPYQGEDV